MRKYNLFFLEKYNEGHILDGIQCQYESLFILQIKFIIDTINIINH
jgi:hypothetical protein